MTRPCALTRLDDPAPVLRQPRVEHVLLPSTRCGPTYRTSPPGGADHGRPRGVASARNSSGDRAGVAAVPASGNRSGRPRAVGFRGHRGTDRLDGRGIGGRVGWREVARGEWWSRRAARAVRGRAEVAIGPPGVASAVGSGVGRHARLGSGANGSTAARRVIRVRWTGIDGWPGSGRRRHPHRHRRGGGVLRIRTEGRPANAAAGRIPPRPSGSAPTADPARSPNDTAGAITCGTGWRGSEVAAASPRDRHPAHASAAGCCCRTGAAGRRRGLLDLGRRQRVLTGVRDAQGQLRRRLQRARAQGGVQHVARCRHSASSSFSPRGWPRLRCPPCLVGISTARVQSRTATGRAEQPHRSRSISTMTRSGRRTHVRAAAVDLGGPRARSGPASASPVGRRCRPRCPRSTP